MSPPALKRQSILPRLDGIQHNLVELRKFRNMPMAEFSREHTFLLVQTYLRLSLEGVFHVGAHILSRLPGNRATEYKEIARGLGRAGIVPQEFADTALVRMAGYRHRLTHFYAEITVREIFEIIRDRLDDFEKFMTAIRELIKNPAPFGLRVE